MGKLTLAILLLAACGRTPSDITIAITRDGFVKVDGKTVTLDELGTLVAARRAAAPLETFAWGGKASILTVLLDVEEDACWRHVDWVSTVLVEQHLWRVAFPGRLDARLPIDAAICGGDRRASRALLVRVLVLQDGSCAFGDRVTRDIAELGAWIDAATRDIALRCVGEIRPRPRARWRDVRPVYDLFRERGLERIALWHTTWIPSREARARSPLPLPGVEAYRPLPGIAEVEAGPDDGQVPEPDEDPHDGEPSPEEDLRAMIDGHRLDSGLALLSLDEALSRAAVLHASEMDRLGYFGHFSPTPGIRSPSDRLAKQGWPEERRHAELLSKAETAGAALAAMLEKAENATMLADPGFTQAGVAKSGDYWVLLLGADP